MSGYAAPKLDNVRIGFIGLGNRGPAAVERMSIIEGVQIKGLCDKATRQGECDEKETEGTTHSQTCTQAAKTHGRKCVNATI